MKRKNILHFALAGTAVSFMVLAGISCSIALKNDLKVAEAIDKPNNIDLNDCTDEEIRDYYSYLNDLPDTERRGQNLLKNLKYILVNNPSNPSKPAQYFSYSQVREIYRITDRNWYSSPATGISGYNASNNTITNFDYSEDPYLYYYYRDDNFTNPHTATAKITSKEGTQQTLLNQEHIWSKSHGFGEGSGVVNAGTDLHHLVAADVAVNKWAHSNASYGYVASEDSWANTKVNWDNGANAILNNKRGTPANSSSQDEESVVFEPRDQDKGDFARALLFMVARYNYVGDSTSTHSVKEPNLELVDYVIAEGTTINCSTKTDVAKYGKLSDLLEWHKLDPVITNNNQDFEMHRNNLIYRNYQYTRNPFIDFPEWVDLIWGDQKETGVARPQSDMINGYGSTTSPTSITLNASTTTLGLGNTFNASVVSVSPSDAYKGVKWTSSNDSVATVTSAGLISGISSGNATITATSILDSSVTATISVSVSDIAVTSISLNKSETTVQCGGRETLNVTFTPANATIPTISWTSSDDSVITVSNGKINGKSEGTATITADDGNGHTASCVVTVSGVAIEYSETTYEKVTSEDQIDINRKMAIVANTYDYALGTNQKSNNREAVQVIKDTNANTITMTDSIAAFSVEEGSIENTYSFKDSSGYIYAAGTGTNYYLRSKSAKDDSASFTLTVNTTGSTAIVSHSTGNNYLRFNNGASKLFSCYANSSQQNEVSLYQQMAIPLSGDIPVTSIAFTKTSMMLGTSMEKQLEAVISPAEATNQDVTWSSDAPSVATVNGEGLVHGVSAGTATISVVTDDGGYTASCTVTVIDSGIGNKYYQKITSLEEIVDGKYVVLAVCNDEYMALPSDIPTSSGTVNGTSVLSTNNKISYENGHAFEFTLDATISSGTVTDVTLQDSNGNYLIYGGSSTGIKGSTTSSNKWLPSLSERENKGTFIFTSNSESTRMLKYSSTYNSFGAYTSSSDSYFELELYKYVEETYVLSNFISDFMNAFTCDSTGNTGPVFNGDWTWANLKAKYNSLSTSEKNSLKTCVADENGSDEAKCVARYDYLLRKYGVTVYENFMNRTITQHSNVIRLAERNDVIVMVVAVVTVALSAGAFFLFRKKKER